MRKFIWLIIAAAVLWGGYWFVGASAVEGGMRAWLAEREEDAWQAEYASLKTSGFPNRFDTVIQDLALTDPATGLSWQAPRFEILALSYKPNHIIALWPEVQTIASPLQRIRVTSRDMRGSVVFVPKTTLELDRLTVEMSDFELSSTLGWDASLREGLLATRQNEAIPLTHDISFSASGFAPSANFMRRIDPGKLLPEELSLLTLDMAMSFTKPWDRSAIEEARPQITRIDLTLAQAQWGNLDLALAGTLDVDANGTPSGEITVKAKNWREMIEIGRASGALPEGTANALERALEFVAAMSGNKNTIDAPLSFAGGRVSLGPLPLGPAPHFVIR